MLHERGAELARISGALRIAREGGPSLVLLTGPLGIGRSALLQRLAARAVNEAEDVRVLRANAAPVEQDFAFGVVRQLFDSLLAGAAGELSERWTRESACFANLALADEDMPAGDRPTAAYEPALSGLLSLLESISADGPLLILVDDLQWVDTPSLRWLAYLAKRLRGLRAVVVCTLRDGEPRARHPLLSEVVEAATHRLRPRPLSSAGTAALIRDHFGEPGDEEFIRACHETCAGSPLSLTAVLLDLAAAGHRPTADRAGAVRAARPADLRERLARSVRLQPAPVRHLAAAIAALGEPGDPALVPRLAGLDPIDYAAALRDLRALGLAADEREPRFVHPVVADAVQSSLSVAEREWLHDHAAELLYRAGRSDEQVAAQLMAGVTSRHDWSAGVLRAAADVALRRGAPEVAVRYLRRALLDASLAGEGRSRLLIDLATAERGLDPVACERHISQAIPLLPTPGHRAAAALRLTPAVMGLLRPSAVDLLRQVADELGPPDALGGAAREMALRLEARLRQSGIDDPAELTSAVERLYGMGRSRRRPRPPSANWSRCWSPPPHSPADCPRTRSPGWRCAFWSANRSGRRGCTPRCRWPPSRWSPPTPWTPSAPGCPSSSGSAGRALRTRSAPSAPSAPSSTGLATSSRRWCSWRAVGRPWPTPMPSAPCGCPTPTGRNSASRPPSRSSVRPWRSATPR
ncbi:AAA family ATPase [Streptomyces sp. FXJ1.4098]|nr:AAA family ATPase [Streptomyces sp. FXJ1.4098]